MASKTALKTREKGAGTIYRDGKRWYLKVRVNGKAKTTMLRNADGMPCTTEKDANAAADSYRKILFAENREEMAVQIAEAKKLKRQSGLKLDNAWEEYLKQPNRPDSTKSTMTQYKSHLMAFFVWIQDEHPEIDRIGMIDRVIALEYMAYLWKTGIAARTYNAYIQALRMIFKHIAEPAALDENPFADIPHKTVETASRREFTQEQVNAIFAGFESGFFYNAEVEQLTAGRERGRVLKRLQYIPMHKEEMRVLLNICCYTGCRGQDGCLMQWENIDLDRGRVSYIPRKTARKTNHRAVTLPMHPALRAALLDALQWRGKNKPGEDYVLPYVADRYKRTPSGIQKDVMKIIRCATGLETTAETADAGRRKLAPNAYSLHSFRHTFVSFCANAGVPLAVVAEIVGHGNPAMTRHYSHITTEAKQGAIDALAIAGSPEAGKALEEQAPKRAALHRLADRLPMETIQAILKQYGRD